MRPEVAFVMGEWVPKRLFRESWDRLEGLCDLVSREAVAIGPDVAGVELLVTGWGVPRLDRAAFEAMPRLRAIVHGAGTVKAFVTDDLWERGIRLTSVAGANAVPVAEYAVAAIVLANKGAFLAQRRYRATARGEAWTAKGMTPGNRAKRVGIVSASRVGRLVVELLAPYELEVVFWDPMVDSLPGATWVELDELLATCHVVSLHAPLLPETVGLIDGRRLALMRDGATFINTARGAIVDGAALDAELLTGRLNAVIDTTEVEPLPADSPLYDLPNVFLTPHIAGSAGTELPRMGEAAVDELERWVRGEPFAFEITRDQLPWIA